MNFTKKKKMHTIFKNTKNEYNNIISGYDSKKYLNKTYSSNTKTKIKTRDKNKNKNKNKNKIYKVDQYIDNNLNNSYSSVESSITDSLREVYCNIKDTTLEDYIDIEIMHNLDESEWTLIDVK